MLFSLKTKTISTFIFAYFIDDPVCVKDTASNPDEQSDNAKDEIHERSGYEVTGGDMVLDAPSVERASSVGGINQWDYHVIPYKVVVVHLSTYLRYFCPSLTTQVFTRVSTSM